MSRRAFFRLGRRRPGRDERPAQVPRTGFDLREFYRQRQLLGRDGDTPPPFSRRADLDGRPARATPVGTPEARGGKR